MKENDFYNSHLKTDGGKDEDVGDVDDVDDDVDDIDDDEDDVDG